MNTHDSAPGVRDLMDLTDYPEFDIDEVTDIFIRWKNDKRHDIMGYRDYCYRSVMTGTIAAKHHTPWIEELDDSLERYLSPGTPTLEKAEAAGA